MPRAKKGTIRQRRGPGDSAVAWKTSEHMPVLMDKKKDFPAFWSLNLRQQTFVMNYVGGPTRFNATQSYIAAGYTSRGRLASHTACLLKANPKVAAAIHELMSIAGLTEDWIKARVGELAAGVDIADVEPYVQGTKSLVDLRNEGVNTLAIAKARVMRDRDGHEQRAVELHDPMPALREAARLVGLGGSQNRLDVNVSVDFKGMGTEELKRLERAISGQLGDIREAEYSLGGPAGLIEADTDAAPEVAVAGAVGDGES